MIRGLKHTLRAALYHAGILGGIHRLRNRNTLTVFMFHRVLPSNSDSLAKAEREFAFTVEGFERCLDFIRRHYSPVSLEQVKRASTGRVSLPSRAALITFDDGWRDTLLYALPAMKSRNMPGVLFLATEAFALGGNRWWQDQLVEIMLNPEAVLRMAGELGIPTDSLPLANIARKLTARMAEMAESERKAMLASYIPDSALPRQMLEPEDLAKLSPQIAIAGHGHTHGPLTYLTDPGRDLRLCKATLTELKADAKTLSFPHGAYDSTISDAAHQAGFDYLFSSDPHLVSFKTLRNAKHAILSRIHIPENIWTCDDGKISFPKLSSFLFFRKAT